jgi:hypothetical protein
MLLRLQELLGGNISKGIKPQKETHRQTYFWAIYGNKHIADVAKSLVTYCHLKRPQFALAASLGDATTKERSAQFEKFKELKRIPHNPIDHAPLAYVGGIIDTDACIRSRPIKVEVSQKYGALSEFFAREFDGSVYVGEQIYRWNLNCSNAVKFMRLIQPYVYVKQYQIQTVLNLADKKIDEEEAHNRLQKVQGGVERPFVPKTRKRKIQLTVNE